MRSLVIALTLLLARPALADPCGLVPPVRLLVHDDRPIERIGVQQTWVFHQDGIETIAIRPGFEGRASEFGMLVPLPAPPSLHKVPDGLFEQLAWAVDPPDVVVDVRDGRSQVLTREFLERLPAGRSFQSAVAFSAGVSGGVAPKKHWIEVLSEEAIGSYEVAILEAGSTLALKRWMEARAYAYPDGMEDVVADYVERGWVFAAVKARLGTKSGLDPVPGQRKVRGEVPDDAPFTGHVQGMAFRFAIDEPVVPMRLSTFNGDDLHNRMFVLADQPLKVAELPESLVRWQIDGAELRRNLTSPLDMSVTGDGDLWRIRPHDIAQIAQLRDPVHKSWAAAELIAGDLQAAHDGTTRLEREEWGVQLVNISYALGLKGAGVEAVEREVVAQRFGEPESLGWLDQTTLTVIDGDFDAQVLRNHDLHLVPYELPTGLNGGIPWEAPADLTVQVWSY